MSIPKLFMRVINGRPIDHPQSEYGMKILFPPEQYPEYDYNLNVLPIEYYPLETLPQPNLQAFQKLNLTYEFLGNKVRDVWTVLDMTVEEQNARLEELEAIKPYPSWTLDELTSEWVAPLPKPDDSNEYEWNEQEQRWILIQE